jgi:hypothetical protein
LAPVLACEEAAPSPPVELVEPDWALAFESELLSLLLALVLPFAALFALADDCDAFAFCEFFAADASLELAFEFEFTWALDCAACCCACTLCASVCENGAAAGVFTARPVLPVPGFAEPESAPRIESDDMAVPLI